MIHIADDLRPIFEQIDFAPEMIFTSPDIKPWRKLPDRENCVWEIPTPAGPLRLHVKRFFPTRKTPTPPQIEAAGYRFLADRGIPTAQIAAFGRLPDRRSFIAIKDLAGFTPADKLIESGYPFEKLLAPTAALTAQLHNARLHHRDLYLCHFLANPNQTPVDIRLIDAARVRPLRGLLLQRWIIKDLSQFWFSTQSLPITDPQRAHWLRTYAQHRNLNSTTGLLRSIQKKSTAIAAHDRRLRRKHPQRNISLPKNL